MEERGGCRGCGRGGGGASGRRSARVPYQFAASHPQMVRLNAVLLTLCPEHSVYTI